MKTHFRLLNLVHHSNTFLITTIDERCFPTVMAVSAPLKKEGLQQLTFYIDRQSEAAQNIIRNPQGSIFCYDDMHYESLLLKGSFCLLETDQLADYASALTDYQQTLAHQDPVLCQFTSQIAKAHLDQETRTFIF